MPFCDFLNNYFDFLQLAVNFFFIFIGWPAPDYNDLGSILGCNIV